MFSSNQTNVAAVPAYIEDVFSTWLYTGNNSTQNIVNGIDLSTKGGLVWIKDRLSADYDHTLYDTARSLASLNSNTTRAQQTYPSGYEVDPFNTNGFTVNSAYNQAVNRPTNYVSWTFRKQAKFFDVVTYTGTGANRTIAHALGSVPGCIIVKRTDTTANWAVYHNSLANTQYLVLNTTAAAATGATWWNSTTPTSAVFSVGTDASVNASGGTYVAYIFAHDAGGFGLTGTDNVISCGTFTTDGSGNATVSLGYEPQWLMTKGASGTGSGDNWFMKDNMRGMPASASSGGVVLRANTSGVETTNDLYFPTATGFTAARTENTTYIYIAIRRGPMKVPSTGSSVFNTNLETNGTNPNTLTTGFPVDLNINTVSSSNSNRQVLDRLRGFSNTTATYLQTNSTGGEATSSGGFSFASNTGVIDLGWQNQAGGTFWSFCRAPSFFDQVCYTGNSVAGATQAHNLGVVPQLIFVISRSVGTNWNVYSASIANTEYLSLNTTDAVTTATNRWNSTTPTSSVFTLGTNVAVNSSTVTYVAYLFATCPNVSKVGSYTGNGSTQTINCGFTGGARFVLIKRTDSTGDWYVYDTARGMTVLTDPYLLLNTTAAQTATLGSVTTATTGFALNSSILAAINISSATYIFLAIA